MGTPRSLTQAVDQAIAERNRRFLADRAAIEAAVEEGDRMRRQMVMEGMTGLALPGDPLPDGSVAR